MACFGQCCWRWERNRPEKEDLLFRIVIVWSHLKLLLFKMCVLWWRAEHLVFCEKANKDIRDPNKWTSIFPGLTPPYIRPSSCGLDRIWTQVPAGPWSWRPHRPPHCCGLLLHRPQDWLWCPHDHQSSFTFMMRNLSRQEPASIILWDQDPFSRLGILAGWD